MTSEASFSGRALNPPQAGAVELQFLADLRLDVVVEGLAEGKGRVVAIAGKGGLQAAAPAKPQTKPLPFDPTAAPGLSQDLLRSHYDNNYTGAVNRLGAISAELAGLDLANTPGYRLNGLKREELVANAVFQRASAA